MSVIPVDITNREEAMEWLLRHGYSVDMANEELATWESEATDAYDEDGEEYEEASVELDTEQPDIIIDTVVFPDLEEEEEAEEEIEEDVCEDCECDPCECDDIEWEYEDDEDVEEEYDDGAPSSVER